MDTVKLTREELFQMVWEKPVQKLARSFGISDTGLSKICKRMQVPRPTRGFWAKVRAGAEPHKPKLPKLSRDGIDQVEIRPSPVHSKVKPDGEPPIVVVTETLTDPHPLVSRTLTALNRGKPDERGVVLPRRRKTLNIRVHRESIDRACRIMDALIKMLATLSYPVSIQSQERATTTVLVNGESLNISLEEKISRSDHELTPYEKAHYGRLSHIPPRHDYQPTGILSLNLLNAVYGSQSRWADTKHHKLEERLGEFIKGLETAVIRIKEWREENERRRIEYEREQQLRMEEEERIRLEQAKAKKLSRDVQSWMEAGRIRAYVKELKELPSNVTGLEDWIIWAKRHADAIDPFNFVDAIVFTESAYGDNGRLHDYSIDVVQPGPMPTSDVLG